MDDKKIKEIVENLDHTVPKDGALANFYIYGGGEDETAVIANKLGYLRLGTEFLKAAYAESVENMDNESSAIRMDISYLKVPGSSMTVNLFERSEDLAKPIHKETKPSISWPWIGPAFVIALLVVFVGLAIVGFFTILGLING